MPVHNMTGLALKPVFSTTITAWIAVNPQGALNDGLLPDGFYAMAEQHAGRTIPDILTLHGGPPSTEPLQFNSANGGTAVAEAPPRVRHHESVGPTAKGLRRTLAIRHVSGHRLIAILELVSPANKDRQESVEVFASKAIEALDAGVHVVVIDLFPPGPYDPRGIPGAIREWLAEINEPNQVPAAEPLTLASYVAGPKHRNLFGDFGSRRTILPEMPLFLNRERYVGLPLESTYLSAYQGMPAFWRNVLEDKRAARINRPEPARYNSRP